MTFARIHGWLRAHPLAGDAALAGVVLVCMVVGSFADPHGSNGPVFGTRTPSVTALVLAVLGAVSLVLRRRNPLAVLGLTGGVTVADLLAGNSPAPIAIAPVVALYTVAAHTDRATTYRVGITTMGVLTATAMVFGDAPWYAQENVAVLAWTGLAATAGDAVRSRRAIVESIRERAERAERTREEEARRRVAEERLRIARDLHDVVAHHIALVNVQAGVAAHVMDKRPDQAKEALAHVREASRSALNELRATVGLLRQSGDPEAPTEPAPGLALLDDLLGGFRRAGLPVELAALDPAVRAGLPAAVDLAAYRVIQEALTNVRKHAGPDARAEVSVVRVGPNAEVTVIDNGTGTGEGATAGDGGGHGLLGMRERVSALGGTCTAGPRYGGGFRVQAILPVKAADTARTAEARKAADAVRAAEGPGEGCA